MTTAPSVDEETLVSMFGAEAIIDRFVDEFVRNVDLSDVSVRSFDQLVLAEGESVDELVWGTAGGFSKHLVFLPDSFPDDRIEEVRSHVQRLNLQPTEEATDAFMEYLREHFDSLERLESNVLLELPVPKATKIGDYPVVNVVLYEYPGHGIVTVVEMTLKSSGFAIDDREDVMEQVGERTPVGDVERYADSIYEYTFESLEDEVTSNLVPDLTADALRAAGYHQQGTAAVPEGTNLLHEGATASQWQKELWAVDGVDASTGFARVWLIEDEHVGVVQPTASDVSDVVAIDRMRTELAEVPARR